MKQNTHGNDILDFSMANNIVVYFVSLHGIFIDDEQDCCAHALCTCVCVCVCVCVYVCVCVCEMFVCVCRERETDRQTDRQRESLRAQQRFFLSFSFSYFHSSSGLDLIDFQCKCQHLAFQMSRHKYVLIIIEHTHWNGPQNEAYECVWEMISQLMMK